jgi:hypothetical protein
VSLLPALYYVPFCCLGAIVCNAVVSLIDWPEMIKAIFLSPQDCFVMLVRLRPSACAVTKHGSLQTLQGMGSKHHQPP